MKANYRGAVHDAIAEAMRTDERVVLLGEDVGRCRRLSLVDDIAGNA